MSRAGRPVSIIEINLNKIDQTVKNVTSLCSNDSVKSEVQFEQDAVFQAPTV